MLREFVMLMAPNPVDGFPLDILAANLVAAFLLGLVTRRAFSASCWSRDRVSAACGVEPAIGI